MDGYGYGQEYPMTDQDYKEARESKSNPEKSLNKLKNISKQKAELDRKKKDLKKSFKKRARKYFDENLLTNDYYRTSYLSSKLSDDMSCMTIKYEQLSSDMGEGTLHEEREIDIPLFVLFPEDFKNMHPAEKLKKLMELVEIPKPIRKEMKKNIKQILLNT